MQTALLCLCLLGMAFSTPVPLPLPGRAAGNCVGQHRILLKGCNAKHGFYVFKYFYSFSTRRNQTQIEKEEAKSQSTGPSLQSGEDDARQEPTEDGAAPERGDDGGADAVENGIVLKTENRSTPGISRDAHGPHPGTSTWARSGIGVVGPTPASSEGSGDLDLVVEVNGDGGVSILPQGGHPSEAVAGNRSGIRSEDRDDSAPGRVPVEGAMTASRERASATGRAEDEGSGEATVPGRGQEDATGMGGTAFTSVTEKMEDVQVDTKGVDEYAYIPDSGSVTITQGKVGSTAGGTSFTQISPDADDEVNIFIGRANIHVGEQETTLAGATVGSKDDSIPTRGTSSPMPKLGVAAAHDGDDDDGIPARRQPEGPTTTATTSHGDSVTSSPRDSHPTEYDEDGATTISDRAGLVASSPWRVAGGDVTVPAGAGGHGDDDKEKRGERQRFKGRLGRPAVTTPTQGGDEEAAAAVPAGKASIRLGATVTSPGASEGDCTTTLRTASGHKTGKSTMTGRGGSGEVRPATLQPRREGQLDAGAGVRQGGAGLKKPPRTDKVPSPRGKAGSQASSRTQARASGHGGDAEGSLPTTKVEGSSPLQAGQARGSVAAGKGRERGQGGEAGAVAAGARAGQLPGHHGRRPGAAAPGAFAALGHSRQVDQVKRADELHVREQAFYALGGAGGGPRGPYAGLGSADSSQSSEGEQGSHSDSRQAGSRPSAWGAPGHPHGHWRRGAL